MESQKIKLRYKDRELLFKKEYSQLKIKVALNWFEILTLIIISFFITFKLCLSINLGTIPVTTIISIIIALLSALLFSSFRKYQLKITRFDKEDIYKKVSNDLIDKTRKNY